MIRLQTLLVSITLILCITSCNNTSQKQENFYKGTIKVGHLVALDMAPLFIAKEAGYFKDEGLDLETVFFSSPGDNNAALAGGSIKFSTNPFTLPYLGENSGVPMRIVSSAGGLGIIEVIIQGKYEIDTEEELVKWIKSNPDKKIKIAVLKGDTLEMIVQKLLENNGLTYDDVEMVWMNDLLLMVDAFEIGEVDILSHIKPYTTKFIVNKGAKSLTNNSEIWGYGTPNCTVAVLDKFAQKYPETIKAYLRALHKGFQFIVDNPEAAATMLYEDYYKVDKKILLHAFNNQPKEVVLKPNVEGMMMAIDALVKLNYIKKPTTDIIITKFLDEIEEDLAN